MSCYRRILVGKREKAGREREEAADEFKILRGLPPIRASYRKNETMPDIGPGWSLLFETTHSLISVAVFILNARENSIPKITKTLMLSKAHAMNTYRVDLLKLYG